MTRRYPLTDIHCHLLPSIDDGANDWQATLAMAQMATQEGVRAIVVTPHQLGAHGDVTATQIRERTAQVQDFLLKQQVSLRVLPGAEIRIEPDLLAKLQRGELMTMADRGRHVLLELPAEIFLPLGGLLEQLRSRGIVAILAHPERNLGILHQPQVLGPLVDAGCLLQVTGGSFTGSCGPQVRQFAHWMLQQGLVHFVSTDAHGPRSRRPLLGRAFDCVAELTDEETAVDLCCRNPAAVAAGETVQVRRQKPRKSGLADWFRWRKAG